MLKLNLINPFLALVYSLLFIAGYILFLNNHFQYAGFTLSDNTSNFSLAISIIISIIPIFFYRGLKAISSFIAICIYLLLYIPTILTFTLGLDETVSPGFIFQSAFMGGMSLLFLADRVNIEKLYSFPVEIDLFMVVRLLTIISGAIMVFYYRDYLNFVSFEDVYIQRFASVEVGRDLFMRYLSSWLSNFMIPVCLAYGLINRDKTYFIVGAFACLVIYLSTAAKSVLLFPLVSAGLYFLLCKVSADKAYVFIVLSLIVLMAVSLGVDFNVASSLIWMRTIGNGGYITMRYYDFFSDHPLTYYTHINIVKMITDSYPYGDADLGQVVGRYFFSEDMSANANFWATDGIAAAGISGVVICSTVLFFIFVAFNVVSKGYGLLFLIITFIPYINSLLNTSLFSSLWTGGALLIMCLLLFADKTKTHVHKERFLQVGATSNVIESLMYSKSRN